MCVCVSGWRRCTALRVCWHRPRWLWDRVCSSPLSSVTTAGSSAVCCASPCSLSPPAWWVRTPALWMALTYYMRILSLHAWVLAITCISIPDLLKPVSYKCTACHCVWLALSINRKLHVWILTHSLEHDAFSLFQLSIVKLLPAALYYCLPKWKRMSLITSFKSNYNGWGGNVNPILFCNNITGLKFLNWWMESVHVA